MRPIKGTITEYISDDKEDFSDLVKTFVAAEFSETQCLLLIQTMLLMHGNDEFLGAIMKQIKNSIHKKSNNHTKEQFIVIWN